MFGSMSRSYLDQGAGWRPVMVLGRPCEVSRKPDLEPQCDWKAESEQKRGQEPTQAPSRAVQGVWP